MPTAHEVIAALPTLTPADKELLRELLTRRMVYALAATEDPEDFIALDPDSGVAPLYLIFSGVLFAYNPLDAVTAHDGTTCLVTSDGKRYKSDSIGVPFSVLDKDTIAQPVLPTVGDCYLVPAAATGAAWAGKDAQVAQYTESGWHFTVVPIGRFLYVKDETAFYHRNASGNWTAGVGSITLGDGTIAAAKNVGGGSRVNWVVENQTTNTPATITEGVSYIIGPSPTGRWSGHAGKIAAGENSGETIYTPAAGWIAFDKALSKRLTFIGSGWAQGSDAVVLLETQVASSSSTIDFTIPQDDVYDAFEIRLTNIKPASDDVQLLMRIATAGPVWQTTSYNSAASVTNVSGTSAIANSNDLAMRLTFTPSTTGALGNAAGESLSGVVRFTNPETSDYCQFSYDTVYSQADGLMGRLQGAGRYGTAVAIVGVRFVFTGGSIAGGRFSLYGIRKN